MTKGPVTGPDLDGFMARLTAKMESLQASHTEQRFVGFTVSWGSRFVTIKQDMDRRGFAYSWARQRLGYAFVEVATGDIYKADIRKPAKHPRGNIFEADPVRCCEWSGIVLLRKVKDWTLINASSRIIGVEHSHEEIIGPPKPRQPLTNPLDYDPIND